MHMRIRQMPGIVAGRIFCRFGIPLPHRMKLAMAGELNEPQGQQNVKELLSLCQYIARHDVRSILEIGSCFGHTLHAMAMFAAPGARIRSIDLGTGMAYLKGIDTGKYLSDKIADLRLHGYDADVLFGDSHGRTAIE